MINLQFAPIAFLNLSVTASASKSFLSPVCISTAYVLMTCLTWPLWKLILALRMTFVWGPVFKHAVSTTRQGICIKEKRRLGKSRSREGKKRGKRTLPYDKSKLDTFAILVVAEFHAHVGVGCFVVAEALRHFRNVARARVGESEVVRRR